MFADDRGVAVNAWEDPRACFRSGLGYRIRSISNGSPGSYRSRENLGKRGAFAVAPVERSFVFPGDPGIFRIASFRSDVTGAGSARLTDNGMERICRRAVCSGARTWRVSVGDYGLGTGNDSERRIVGRPSRWADEIVKFSANRRFGNSSSQPRDYGSVTRSESD